MRWLLSSTWLPIVCVCGFGRGRMVANPSIPQRVFFLPLLLSFSIYLYLFCVSSVDTGKLRVDRARDIHTTRRTQIEAHSAK